MGGGLRLKRGEIHILSWLICIVLQQKPIQHCKAIILQLKKIRKKTNNKMAKEMEQRCEVLY